ncbi:MAG: SpoIIE family protein phosphatase [Trueperaceae bacterium]
MIPLRVEVAEASQVSEARRRATTFALDLGFPQAKLGRLALAVTEAASNLVKHTPHGGEILFQHLVSDGYVGLDVYSLDDGPGIASTVTAMGDGFSTAGGAGTGLGAIRRQADFFDLYSQMGRGTVLVARFWSGSAPRRPERQKLDVGGVRVARPGENVCGDDWATGEEDGRTLVMIVDGLGHGISASAAATEAVRAFRKNLRFGPEDLMRSLHGALRSTRGGVAAVAQISAGRDELAFVGIGNIAGFLCRAGTQRSMVSHPGTVGQELRKVQQFGYPWSDDAVLILYSDGLTSRVDLSKHPGLAGRSAALIAGVLYREYRRGRDDASVVVVKEARG